MISKTAIPVLSLAALLVFQPAREASADETGCLVVGAWGEARGEPQPVIEAVVSTIINRARARGISICDTVMDPAALTSLTPVMHDLFAEAAQPRGAATEQPHTDHDRGQLGMVQAAAAKALAGRLPDRSKGGTHFYSPAGMRQLGLSSEPGWASSMVETARVGPFVFLREKWERPAPVDVALAAAPPTALLPATPPPPPRIADRHPPRTEIASESNEDAAIAAIRLPGPDGDPPPILASRPHGPAMPPPRFHAPLAPILDGPPRLAARRVESAAPPESAVTSTPAEVALAAPFVVKPLAPLRLRPIMPPRLASNFERPTVVLDPPSYLGAPRPHFSIIAEAQAAELPRPAPTRPRAEQEEEEAPADADAPEPAPRVSQRNAIANEPEASDDAPVAPEWSERTVPYQPMPQPAPTYRYYRPPAGTAGVPPDFVPAAISPPAARPPIATGLRVWSPRPGTVIACRGPGTRPVLVMWQWRRVQRQIADGSVCGA